MEIRAIATLLAIRGPLTGTRIRLGDETVIGRAEECDLVLADSAVSRRHARIERRNLAWILHDLGSTGGVLLNRARVEGSKPLLRNDLVQVGQSQFLFDSDLDIENAEFSDRSVYLASPGEETVAAPPAASLEGGRPAPIPRDEGGLDFLAAVGDLFDSARVRLPDALRQTTERLAALFAARTAILMLWDSAAERLRPSVAISEDDGVLADASLVAKAYRERRALLVSDRPDLHAPPGAPAPPAARSVLAAPLELEDGCLGVLYLERHELDAYSLLDLRRARAAARLLAVFIDVRQRAEAMARRLRFELPETPVIGRSAGIRRALEAAARIAPTPATVLLLGETGVGKEVFAREIHRLSPAGARGGPFVAVNCTAIPEGLFESLLFGHEKGAFTGATHTQQGFIEQAHGGTLFLDEIGDLAPSLQPKLLRFLQERAFARVGGSRQMRAETRLVCATNRRLDREVAAGRFREDLYHRIAVMPIEIPPLRERREDIAPLAEAFVQRAAEQMGRPISGIAPDAAMALEKHSWPGNVRELANCVERAVLLCEERVLRPKHFAFGPAAGPGAARDRTRDTQELVDLPPPSPLRSLAEVEHEHIASVLASCGGNQVQAADILGIHRNTLRKKIAEYGIRAQ